MREALHLARGYEHIRVEIDLLRKLDAEIGGLQTGKTLRVAKQKKVPSARNIADNVTSRKGLLLNAK